MAIGERTEWLEADGLGGFASGTATGVRTRRYHALLLTATTPPTGRMVLVSGVEAWVTTAAGRYALSTQRYAPDVLHPDGHSHIVSFSSEPWPTWLFELADGTRVRQEVLVAHGGHGTLLTWRVLRTAGATRLEVRPLLAGRDYHALHHANESFAFTPVIEGQSLTWRPYAGGPNIRIETGGVYAHDPVWYRNFLYTIERERGLDDTEDLASPGTFRWSLQEGGDAMLLLSAPRESDRPVGDATQRACQLRDDERTRRASFGDPFERAADSYLVRRGRGQSIVAGYPWFTDWGRDTFIAIRGLCIATGRLAEAREILLEWAGAVSRGMLPNRFPDSGETPEFNSVDASLWFVIAAHDLFAASEERGGVLSAADVAHLTGAVHAIVEGYAAGTRYGIRADADGLLAAGEPGQQLTWMDARVGVREITPRIGKPVEVQALWLNALSFASSCDPRWRDLLDTGLRSFDARFWNAARGCLHDVVDADHLSGSSDESVRPNQILAVGGLPRAVVTGDRARAVVDLVERELFTGRGLRSLSPREPGYAAHFRGGPAERDAAYHQGTVWPWLLGPFVEAWVRVRGDGGDVRAEAHARFVAPVLAGMRARGDAHVCEVTDAESPFAEGGCPFQAWSLGELIRVDRALRPAGYPRR